MSPTLIQVLRVSWGGRLEGDVKAGCIRLNDEKYDGG
jgi:hypothetical protein